MSEDNKNKCNNIKLDQILRLVQNKKNQQFSFTIKKKMFHALDITPKNILNMVIPTFQNKKPIKIIKTS